MQNRGKRRILIFCSLFCALFCIIFVYLLKTLFTPFMYSGSTFITRKEVKEFDLSYTLGNANNFGMICDDIYLVDINLKKEPPVILYEEIYDKDTDTSPLEKCDLQKIGPCIWRIKNNQKVNFRIFAYERGSERYYFIYKSV